MTPDTFPVGYKFFGPMFAKVGTQTADSAGTYNLSDLVLTGDTIPAGDTLAGAISVQKLAADGTTDGSVYYWRDCKVGRTTYKGWYAGAATTASDMTIAVGEGLCVKMPVGASCTMTVSGEVPNGDIYMTLNDNGHTCGCNPQPTAITDVQTLLPVALEGHTVPVGDSLTTAVSIQKIAADGTTDGAILYWRDCKVGRTTYHGWYAGAATTPATAEIGPGVGLWINCPGTGVALVFPSALAK